MSDRKLYYDDPDRDRCEAVVVERGTIEGRPFVRLDATILYPEGGGQPADRGTIAGVEVTDVRSRGGDVLHLLAAPVEADAVVVLLDVVRRFDFRQQHTAQHLLSAWLEDRHGLATTSFHLGDAYTAIEVAGAPPSRRTLDEVEAELNELIRADRAVAARWVEPADLDGLRVRTRGLPEGHDGPVRLVTIDGIDCNTCGGLHVDSLRKLQAIHLLGAEPARGGGARIRFLAGGRVLDELRRRGVVLDGVRDRLGTGPEEFAATLDRWVADRKRLERRVYDLESEWARTIAAELVAVAGPIVARRLPGSGPAFLRVVAAAFLEARPEGTVVLVGDEGDPPSPCYLVQSGPKGPSDVSALGERIRSALEARGGGTGRMHQGKGGRVIADTSEIERAISPQPPQGT